MGEKPESYEEFRNPPLTEAIIDLRFAPREGGAPTVSFVLWEQLKDAYQGEPQLLIESRERPKGPHGYELAIEKSIITRTRLWNISKTRVLTVGPNQLAIHAMPPGYAWSALSLDAERAFRSYVELAAPLSLTFASIHIMNTIVLPEGDASPAEYVQLPLYLPNGLPGGVSEFSSKWVAPMQGGGEVRLSYAIPPIEPDSRVKLQIELSVGGTLLTPLPPVWESVAEVLARNKAVHREVFFGSITDKAKELFR